LLLTQGHAGDRLGARLVPALRQRFPSRDLIGLGGRRMADEGVRLLDRTDGISAMGYSGLIPQLPRTLRTVMRAARGTRSPLPALVIAIDVWQPLQALHRFAPHLEALPHLCYLPPGPNFIGLSRVHGAASRLFGVIVTPFAHQERLFKEGGGNVRGGGHAGLQACIEEAEPLPFDRREDVLALLPGSRALEIRYSLPAQLSAAQEIVARHRELRPVVCCASDSVAGQVTRLFPGLERSRNARETMARARFALICSGTAALEAAVLGCPGVVTYHGSALQRWEWRTFHVAKLAKLRAAGIASPFVALPNIIAGRELYPELLDVPAGAIASAALRELDADPAAKRESLDAVKGSLNWEDAGEVVAREAAALLGSPGLMPLP
jgi:lipid-A-disaccharide synthase